ALCCFNENVCNKTFLISENKNPKKLGEVDNLKEVFSKIIQYYLEGLNKPLMFLPNTSLIYFKKYNSKSKKLKNKTDFNVDYDDKIQNLVNESKHAAYNSWYGTERKKGDLEDPYVNLFFKNIEIFSEDEFHKIIGDILMGLEKVL
ncbi:MAG: hypothetical protein ACQESP_13220, partial [Candidatus Muiribacteriota bacterium]